MDTVPGAQQHSTSGSWNGESPGPPGSAAGIPIRKRRSRKRPFKSRATMLVTSLLIAIMLLYAGLVAYTWIQKKRGKYIKQPTPATASTKHPTPIDPPRPPSNDRTVLGAPSMAPQIAKRLTAWKDTRSLLRKIETPEYLRSPQTAIEALERHLEQTPSNLLLRIELAKKYMGRSDWQKAADMLVTILEADPAERESRMRLAHCLLNLKDYEGAMVMGRWILEEEPFSTDAHNVLATSYLATDRVGEALPYLRKLVESDRMNIAAHNNLGIAYTRLREYERATEIFQRVIQINSESSVGYFNLAVCQAHLERVADACATLRSAAKRFGAGFVDTWMKDEAFHGIRETIPFQRLSDEIHHEMGSLADQAGSLTPEGFKESEHEDPDILPRAPRLP